MGASSRGPDDAELDRKVLRKPTSAACKGSNRAGKVITQWVKTAILSDRIPADAELVKKG
jgi:hypothetical protein